MELRIEVKVEVEVEVPAVMEAEVWVRERVGAAVLASFIRRNVSKYASCRSLSLASRAFRLNMSISSMRTAFNWPLTSGGSVRPGGGPSGGGALSESTMV